MTLTFSGGNGVFDRWGVIFQNGELARTFQDNLATQFEDVLDEMTNTTMFMVEEFAADPTPAQIAAVDNLYSMIAASAARLIIEMVDDDNPKPDRTLPTAIKELARQMFANSKDIDGNDVSVGSAPDSGDDGEYTVPVTVRTVQNRTTDLESQHTRAESIILRCVRDSQTNNVAEWQETWEIIGEAPITNRADPNWPGGSGIKSFVRTTDPGEDPTQAEVRPGRQILTNADFEDTTATDVFSNWTYVATAGTEVLEEGTTVHRGSKALELLGTAGAWTGDAITQTLNTNGQTLGNLRPNTVYRLHVWVEATASIALADEVTISLKDGSGNVLDGGNAEFTINNIVPGSWTTRNAVFLAPSTIPDVVKVHISVTNAITDGQSIYLDDLCLFALSHFSGNEPNRERYLEGSDDGMGAMQGVQINVFPGDGTADPALPARGDFATITVTNPNTGLFAEWLDRVFDMYRLNLQLPYVLDGTETESDSEIA